MNDPIKLNFNFRKNRLRRKKGAGKGGAGVITRKGPVTKQPPSYYAQAVPPKHMHSYARLAGVLESDK